VINTKTSLALRYSKLLDREHNARAFTGTQAKAAERDHRDHREGGGSREGNIVRQSCDRPLGRAPVHGRRHHFAMQRTIRSGL